MIPSTKSIIIAKKQYKKYLTMELKSVVQELIKIVLLQSRMSLITLNNSLSSKNKVFTIHKIGKNIKNM